MKLNVKYILEQHLEGVRWEVLDVSRDPIADVASS